MFYKSVIILLCLIKLCMLLILISVVEQLNIISSTGFAVVISLTTFIFALYTYRKNNIYNKKKDTFDYIDNLFNKKFMSLIDELNDRMIYFDHYFTLSIDEQMKQKKTVKEIHFFFSNLNIKLENDLLDKSVIAVYFNESFKSSLLAFYLHCDITFNDYPSEIDKIYKNFFDDFENFQIKIKEQNSYVNEYFQKTVVNKIKLKINNEEHTLNEWIKITNLTTSDCTNKDNILHTLQTLKKLYSKTEGIYLSLGNLYHFCYKDNKRSLLFLKKSIEMNPNFIEGYLSLISVTFLDTRDINVINKIIESIPEKIKNDDMLVKQKAGIYINANKIEEGLNIAKNISDKTERDLFISKCQELINKS
ncbi:MAG: hypothetical protein HRT40_06365 [Campylobacteraceae bacterium]|nr:hypothetical protein [Campylobacteraceae bacterium]